MREIKFRGREPRSHGRGWVYGGYFFEKMATHTRHIITYSENGLMCFPSVDPETVGQYTGLKDKNGREVYDGDILHVLEVSERETLEYESPVEFFESCFMVTQPNNTQVPLFCFHGDSINPLFEITVIGNIYEEEK